MASLNPDLRIFVEGNPNRIYRSGDTIKGKVVLFGEKQELIRTLSLNFIGTCITKTTRPFYVTGENQEARNTARKEYTERTHLFNEGEVLLSASSIDTNKYTYFFEFKFPELSKTSLTRWAHGSKYSRRPHALPPSFDIHTNNPGGRATVSYFLQAKLVYGDMARVKRVTHTLAYQPPSSPSVFEPRVTSRVLYAQTLKVSNPKTETTTAMDRVILRISQKPTSRVTSIRIVPVLSVPDEVAPGQLMPVSFALKSLRGGFPSQSDTHCSIDSFTLVLSTTTTAICGRLFTQPQDKVTKDVTCVSRTNISTPIPFDTIVPLTTNLRLVDDSEAVPTFKTYTITRHYSLTATVGIKCDNQAFTIRSTTPLRLLPRNDRVVAARESSRDREQFQDEVPIDPLPLYVPREPSAELEFAPLYDEVIPKAIPTSAPLIADENGPSTSTTVTSDSTSSFPFDSTGPSTPWSYSDVELGGSGYFAGVETPVTQASIPSDETSREGLEEVMRAESKNEHVARPGNITGRKS